MPKPEFNKAQLLAALQEAAELAETIQVCRWDKSRAYAWRRDQDLRDPVVSTCPTGPQDKLAKTVKLRPHSLKCRESAMQFTETEARYLDCLAKQMTFEEMAVELGMTVEEVHEFGMELFERIFAERRRRLM